MGKFLRFIGILFMSLTAAFTVLGGVGTTCVALGAEKYDTMAGIVPFKWLYVLYVIVTLAIGIMGIRAVILLIKGRANAYRYSMIALIAGIIVGAIHMATSRALRGSSMPVDAVVYTTVLTFIIFLIFKIPGVWAKVDFTKAKGNAKDVGGGLAAIVMGGLALSIQLWMAPTHTLSGINYGDAFHTPMLLIGWALVLMGISLLARAVWKPALIANPALAST
ncbi:MAG: hypothetical protein HN413_08725 [Chloroflexi bacterium]|jgi:hypothetical protein|nr:hypothetical protein [Chloroflexota bacterium]